MANYDVIIIGSGPGGYVLRYPLRTIGSENCRRRRP